MRIECQYHGDGTVDRFDGVQTFYRLNAAALLIVFNDGDFLEINLPDHIREII